MTVRTRFAPSPTGYLHVGGARTALFSWLFARKHGGQFVLRIEDTDLERSTDASKQAILDGMAWLGLDWDEGPIYQTDRFDQYNAAIDRLLETGHAYRCDCSKERLDALRESQMANKEKPRYDGHCRGKQISADEPHVVRFLNPSEGEVSFDDLVRGTITVANAELDDLIIRRTDGSPTYNLTVAVDDVDMQITHVIRGDDHINNTPRQINMMQALGLEPPKFAHLPMILGDDGSRLSKRHGAVSVMQYRDDGYLPDAMLNYLVRLGWSHGDQEIFSKQEMIDLFDLKDVNKSAASFDTNKLNWINQEYINTSSLNDLAKIFDQYKSAMHSELGAENANGTDVRSVFVESQQNRAASLKAMLEEAERIIGGTWLSEGYDEKAAKKALRPVAKEPLEKVRENLAVLETWERQALHDCVNKTAEELDVGMGKVGMPLRVAVVGTSSSPAIDITLELVGQKATLERIDHAIEFINQRAENA